ncbi:hypothetical protein G6011_06047 [Alternaria panax]|uniref:Uncharacterized protein n=1 Tax=Alternaria panax TaxID=48097 RepID=A0AAD4I9M7_9PLEO|nr:hypothetical protein G6011_06047 [Alternaria panax]
MNDGENTLLSLTVSRELAIKIKIALSMGRHHRLSAHHTKIKWQELENEIFDNKGLVDTLEFELQLKKEFEVWMDAGLLKQYERVNFGDDLTALEIANRRYLSIAVDDQTMEDFEPRLRSPVRSDQSINHEPEPPDAGQRGGRRRDTSVDRDRNRGRDINDEASGMYFTVLGGLAEAATHPRAGRRDEIGARTSEHDRLNEERDL